MLQRTQEVIAPIENYLEINTVTLFPIQMRHILSLVQRKAEMVIIPRLESLTGMVNQFEI